MCLAYQLTEVFSLFHMYVDLQKQNLPFISECTGHKLR